MFEYRATVVKVVDGDTMHLELDMGIDIKTKITVRLMDINCPEMSTGEGKLARTAAGSWITNNGTLDVSTGMRQVMVRTVKDKKEKYGRYLAYLYPLDDFGAETLNTYLVEHGHAVWYLP